MPMNAAAKAKRWGLINARLAACKSAAQGQRERPLVQQVQRERPLVQLVAVAKGMMAPQDLRIGGTLLPEEAAQAVSLIIGQDGLLAKVSTEQMRRAIKDLNAWDVGARVLRRTPQGVEPTNGTDDTSVSDKGRVLTALPAQLYGTITLDTLRDNADNPNLPDMIAAMLYTAFRNDLTDLACNGTGDDYAGNAFLALNKGWLVLAAADGATRKVDIAPGTVTYAALATGVVASNNALTWTARQPGAPGNVIRVVLRDPVGASQAQSITTAGTVITVNLATTAGSVVSSTAAQVRTAIMADANASALVSVAYTGASTGAGVVVADNSVLGGGGVNGWADALAAIVAASAPKYRGTAEFFMSPNDALAYHLEVAKAVTGTALIATGGNEGFLTVPINTSPYWPDGKPFFTPPANLVVGMSTMLDRGSEYRARKRALEITIDGAFDFNYRVSDALAYGY